MQPVPLAAKKVEEKPLLVDMKEAMEDAQQEAAGDVEGGGGYLPIKIISCVELITKTAKKPFRQWFSLVATDFSPCVPNQT